MKKQIPLLAIILAVASGSTSISVLAASHEGKGGAGMHGDSMDGMQGGATEQQYRKEQQKMEGDSDEGDMDRDRDRERDEDDSDMDRDRDRDRDMDRDHMQDDS